MTYQVVRVQGVCLQAVVVFFFFLTPYCSAQSNTAYPNVKLVAHRGMQLGYPENFLAAIEAVIRHGLHGVEVDLRTTADGHIVCIHDKRLERTTTGTGAVREKSLEEIQQARLTNKDGTPSPYSVPELQSVLKLVQKHPALLLALDLKEVDSVKVAKNVLAMGVEKQVLFFVADPMDTKLSSSIVSLHPDLRIIVDMLTWWKIEDVPLFAAKALHTNMLFASEWFFPQRGFHHLREHGIEVAVYLWGTHDLEQRFKRAVDLGASYVSTDAPLALLPLVQPSR